MCRNAKLVGDCGLLLLLLLLLSQRYFDACGFSMLMVGGDGRKH